MTMLKLALMSLIRVVGSSCYIVVVASEFLEPCGVGGGGDGG